MGSGMASLGRHTVLLTDRVSWVYGKARLILSGGAGGKVGQMDSKGRLDAHRSKKNLRDAVLQRDGNRCQLDLLFGISYLSGVACTKRLEKHHKSYAEVGAGSGESIDDLVTVCSRCHGLLTAAVRGIRRGQDKSPDRSFASTVQNVKDLINSG